MKYRSVDRDIFAVIALTIIAVILAFTVPSSWLPGRILTLPLVLVLPGYALTAAIFPRRVLGMPERLVFSLGLSIVIVILTGLMLNYTPFGLHVNSWAVSLSAITLVVCAVALVRRRGQTVSASDWVGIGGIGLTFRQGSLLGLAALVVCGAVVISIIGAEQQQYPGFTQFWMLPANGATKVNNVVQIGVSNMESKAMQYRLTVNMDGKIVKEWSSIKLNPNQQWKATLILPQTGHASARRLEAMLYRTDAPKTVYRDVVLWLGT